MSNFTKKAIEASFLKLLNERPLSKITVKDIVEDCGINRNSFYYHFEDLPSLIKSWMKGSIDRLIAKYAVVNSLEDCLNTAISFVLQNRRAFLHIYNSTNRDIFEQYLWEGCKYCVTSYIDTRFENIVVNDNDKTIIINFYKCLIFGQISSWFANGLKEDVQPRCKRLFELCDGVMINMINRSKDQ